MAVTALLVVSMSAAIAGLIPGVRDPISDGIAGMFNPASEGLGDQLRSAAEVFNRGFKEAIDKFLEGWDKSIDKADYLLSQHVARIFDNLDKQFGNAQQLIDRFYSKAETLNKELARTGGYVAQHWFLVNSKLIQIAFAAAILILAVVASMRRRGGEKHFGKAIAQTSRPEWKRKLAGFAVVIGFGAVAYGVLSYLVSHAFDPVIRDLKRQLAEQDAAADFEAAGWTAAQLQQLDAVARWDIQVRRYALLAAVFRVPMPNAKELADIRQRLSTELSGAAKDELEVVQLTLHSQLGHRAFENAEEFEATASRALMRGQTCAGKAHQQTAKERLLAPIAVLASVKAELERPNVPPAGRLQNAYGFLNRHLRCLPDSVVLHRLRIHLIRQMDANLAGDARVWPNTNMAREERESAEFVSRRDATAFGLDRFLSYALPSSEQDRIEKLRILMEKDVALQMEIDKLPSQKCREFLGNTPVAAPFEIPCPPKTKSIATQYRVVENPERLERIAKQQTVKKEIESTSRTLAADLRRLVDGELGVRAREAVTSDYPALSRAMASEAAVRLVERHRLLGELVAFEKSIGAQDKSRTNGTAKQNKDAAEQRLLAQHNAGCDAVKVGLPVKAALYLLDGAEYAGVRDRIQRKECQLSRSEFVQRAKAELFAPHFFRSHQCFDEKQQLKGVECI